MSHTLARLSAALAFSAAFTASAQTGSRSKVITLSDESMPGRFSPHELRVLRGAWGSLLRCTAGDAASGVAVYTLRVAPNGDVATASVTSRGEISHEAQRCLEKTLGALAFDPPEGGGTTLTGSLVVGLAAGDDDRARAFPTPEQPLVRSLPPMVLATSSEPPEGRATDAVVRAARRCVDRAGRAHVAMLVAPDGSIFEATVTYVAGADPSKCVRSHLVTGGRPATVSKVELDVRIDEGDVRVVR